MFRKYRKELVWFGLFTLTIVLLAAGLYLLANNTTMVNAVVILILTSFGLAQIVSYICKFIDWFVDKIFKDEEDDDGHDNEHEYDGDNIKNVVVLCDSKERRAVLIHEYIARLKAYNVDIIYALVSNMVVFSTDKVRVEFFAGDDSLYAVYFDDYFDCTNGYNEELTDYILEEHGIEKNKED